MNAELQWARYTEKALAEFYQNSFSSAAEYWGKAYAVTQGFDKADPRLAASFSNLAVGLRIRSDFKKAEDSYHLAMEAWVVSANWVHSMRVARRARSSLFHLRMEQKHREQYERLARAGYQEKLKAGYAATLSNLAELYLITKRRQEAQELYQEALLGRISAMGKNEFGAVVIQNNIKNLGARDAKQSYKLDDGFSAAERVRPFSSQAARNGWIVEKPPEFTDEGILMAAVLLTCLIDNSNLAHIHSGIMD